MGATSSEYDTRLLKRKTYPAEDFQIAKLLSAYTDYATAKELFYLDILVRLKDIATNEYFFVGCVTTGGENASYHKSTRIGATKASGDNTLLDAGLNTFAHSRVIIDHIDQVWWANMFSVRVEVRSAYYDSTSKVGFEYKIGSGSWTLGGEADISLAANDSMYQEWRKQDFGAVQSDTLYLRAYAINPEGTRIDTYYPSHALAEKVFHLLGLKVDSLSATTGVSTEFYMKEPAMDLIPDLNTSEQYIGAEAFDDEKLTSALSSGMYRGISGYDPDWVYYVSAGEFTHYAIAIDQEGVPISLARMYKNIAFALIDDTSASAAFTDSSPYSTFIPLSNGGYQVGGNIYVQGQGTGYGRNAEIYCRRTNSRNPSLNEDVYADTLYIEPGVNFNASIGAVFSSAITDYDKFTFLEII